MKTRRNTGGFTILELALVVALIGILSGVAAVNVVHYQRTLTQVELDGIAREILVAAQNHLTMVESQGFMDVADWGIPYTKNAEEEAKSTSDMYYYAVDDRIDNDPPYMLDLMLPFASVDEAVRKNGSYVILYQKDPAFVLDVFYASKSGRFPHTFNSDNVNPGWIQEYRGLANKEKRGKYQSENGTAIIGWYGVEPQQTPVSQGETLQPPEIKIVNAEQLYVEVTNLNMVENQWMKFQHARLNLEIASTDGKRKCSIPLISEAGNPVGNEHIEPNDPFNARTYHVILDDVTQTGTRFYEIMKKYQIMDEPLPYPGEDIIIRAVAYNNTELTNIATSASATTNSLFASVSGSVSGSTADIANFRHLENLDSAVSRINADNIHITQANQISDMDRNTFMSGAVSIHYGDNNTTAYFPVTNGGKIEDDGTIVYDKQITYNGNGHKISNVTINVPGDAGLFATLGHSSTVKDLELVNFSVNSSGGNAGALAGFLDNSTVQSVLVHHEIGKSGQDYKVTGKGSIGGLVGFVKDTCTIEQSAAAVYVTSSEGDAGGLIGAISGTQVKVSDSYAGGHTTQGNYKKNNDAVGHYNVTATNGSAGGLIGSSTGTSTESLNVQNCYATTSVDGGTTAGGLIGYVKGATIEKCYVTGYVHNDSKAGAFAGNATNTSFNNDRYLSIVNSKELPNVGSMENPNVSAFDDSPEHYYAHAPCKDEDVPENAVPYDRPTLPMYYGNNYLFKTIHQLSGKDTADWMKKHYGDWPKPETQVVNELAS